MGVQCSWLGLHAMGGQEGPAGAVSRFFPMLETTSPLSAKGGVLLSAFHQPPQNPKAQHSHSTSSSAVGLSPPAFLPLHGHPQQSGVS